MKNNTFAEDYRTFKTYEAEYEAAENEDGKEAARKKVRELYDGMDDEYYRMFTSYKDAKDRGNEYIDISDNIWDENVKGLIDNLREYGIDHFTFSSGWSSAVDTAWLFLQNGCVLEGLVEINSQYKSFGSDEYDKAHGYLFKVN